MPDSNIQIVLPCPRCQAIDWVITTHTNDTFSVVCHPCGAFFRGSIIEGHTTPFIPGLTSQPFWIETLVGKTIASLTFDSNGIVQEIKLDNNQSIKIQGNLSFK